MIASWFLSGLFPKLGKFYNLYEFESGLHDCCSVQIFITAKPLSSLTAYLSHLPPPAKPPHFLPEGL